MKTAFLVQARMGSTRLPHKILRPFYNNNCILDLLINKLNLIIDAKIIIATSVSSENDVIEKFCKEHGIVCFRGEENDVLKRFIDAAETNGVDKIIRICSDNPFLELNSIKRLKSQVTLMQSILALILTVVLLLKLILDFGLNMFL